MKYKYLIEGDTIINGPANESIIYIPTDSQEIREFDIDKNNPPDWCKINGKLGFHPKQEQKWDKNLNHPVLKTQTEKDNEKKSKEKKELKSQLIELKMRVDAGNALNIDMSKEESEITKLKTKYDKL